MGKLNSFLFIAFCIGTYSLSVFAASEISYHGRILKADNTPISGSVNFTLEVRSTGSENCLLYSETQTKTVTDGVFSLSLGTGVRTDSSGYTLENVFSNRQMFSLPTQCTAPAISWTPASTAGRKLVVTFQDGTMGSPESLPVQALNMVPQAIDAQMVGGYSSGELLKVNNSGSVALTQNNLNSVFTGSAWTNIQAVMNGTYAPTSLIAGAGTAAAPSLSFSGDTNTGFYNSGANEIGISSSGVSIFNIGSSGIVSTTTGGATVTTAAGTAAAPTFGFAGDAGLGWYRPAASTLAAATSGIERMRINPSGFVGIGTTSPTAKLQVNDEIRIGGSTSGFVGLKAPAAAGVITYTLPSADGTANQVLTTSGSGILSWGTPSAGITTVGAFNGTSTANGLSVSGNSIFMHAADGTNPGAVSTSAQTFAGAKTFSNELTLADQKEIRLSEASGGGSEYVGLRAPAALAANYTLTLPATAGANGYVLSTDGSGNLSWVNGMNSVSPSAAGNVLTSDGSAWVSSALPIATTSAVGVMRVGSGLAVTASGVVSADFGAAAGKVTEGSDKRLNPAPVVGDALKIVRQNVLGDGYEVITAAALMGSANVYVQDGNSFGTTATLGTNDANPLRLETSGTVRMSIDATGNVGIGTTAPTAKLQVNDEIRIGGSTSGFVGLKAPTAAGSTVYTLPSADGTANQVLTTSGSGVLSWSTPSAGTSGITTVGTFSGTSTANGLSVSGNSIFMHAADGTNPGAVSTSAQTFAGAKTFSSAAVFNSTISALDNVTLANQKELRLSEASGGGTEYIGLRAPNALAANYTLTLPTTAGSSGYVLSTDGSGNLSWISPSSAPAIATTSAVGVVQVGSGLLVNTSGVVSVDPSMVPNVANVFTQSGNSFGATTTLGTNDNHSLHIETSGTVRMSIDATGNVGIGTIAPTAKLHVQDEIRIGGTTSGHVGLKAAAAAGSTTYTLPSADGTANQVLTTSGSGVLSWSTPSAGTSGITTVGTFSGTSTANGLSVSGNSIFMHAADGTNPGAVSNSAQTFAGAKTFSNELTLADQKEIRLSESSGGGSEYIGLRAPSTLAANYTLTLPVTAGTNGYVLSTDGSGNLSWVNGMNSVSPSAAGNVLTSDGSAWVSSALPIATTSSVGVMRVGAGLAVTASGIVSADFGAAAGKVTEGSDKRLNPTPVVGDALKIVRQNVLGDGYEVITAAALIGSASVYVQDGNSFGTTATIGTNDGHPLRLETSGTVRMTVDTTGNVGIGTTSPTAKLHVQDEIRIGGTTSGHVGLKAPAAAGSTSYTLPSADGTANQVLTTSGSGILSWTSVSASGSSSFPIALGSAGTPSMNFSGDTNTGIYSPGADLVAVSTSGIERIRISASGYVGIGTTAALNPLHVVANASGGGTLAVQNISTSGYSNLNLLDTSGNSVGSVGFANSAAALVPDTIFIGSTMAKDLTFATNSNERMRINTSGNVGVGTTSPGAGTKLSVYGQIHTKSASTTSNSIDWSNGNAITTSHNCSTAISFVNLRDGGSYTLIVTSTTTTKCDFSATSTGDDAAAGTLTYKYSPANAVRTGSSHTVYSLLRVGTIVYVSWITGF